MNLEAIYVDSEEFSFEELLAKKRGIYGITSKHDKIASPSESVFKPIFLKSPETELTPKVAISADTSAKRSPLQTKTRDATPSPKPSPHVSFDEFKSNDEDEVVSVPIRGKSLLTSPSLIDR